MSHESEPLETELSAIESTLEMLVPVPSRLDRDRVMYCAGQAAGRPPASGQRGWAALAASLGLVVLVESALLARPPAMRVVERVVVINGQRPVPVASPAVPDRAPAPLPMPIERAPALGGTGHDRLVGQVLRYGLDGLSLAPPVVRGEAEPWPASSGSLLREELRKVLDPGDPS